MCFRKGRQRPNAAQDMMACKSEIEKDDHARCTITERGPAVGCFRHNGRGPGAIMEVQIRALGLPSGFTWTRLAVALRNQELRAEAIAHADAIFQARCAPWCPEIF
jgi:hypothetical protein